MRERRRHVLEVLRRAAGPVSVAEVADQLGVHLNTARFHLEALVKAETIERTADHRPGPGRPPVAYRLRPGLARGPVRHYRTLAEILLSQLSATTDDPSRTAVAAGRAWGAHLVPRPPPFRTVDRVLAIEHLMGMLDELDFAPEHDTVDDNDDDGAPDRIRLRHCPFLELAERYRDVICPVHLGLMQGALSEIGAPITVSELKPFAEPTACLAHLASAT